MLDGSPILDIKPYLSSVPAEELERGWIAEVESRTGRGEDRKWSDRESQLPSERNNPLARIRSCEIRYTLGGMANNFGCGPPKLTFDRIPLCSNTV